MKLLAEIVLMIVWYIVQAGEKEDRANKVYLTSNLLNTPRSASSQAEIAALTSFYQSLNGASWLLSTNWLAGDPCLNNWYGVDCNFQGNVVTLYFHRNRLNGLIPDSIADLKHLQYLYIFNDADDGSTDMNIVHKFNPSIMKLSKIVEICMANVRMTGTISNAAFVHLPYLESINFANNYLEGTLFWQWGNLPALKNFEASGNQFTGNFPTTASLATALEVIDVSFNSLTGNFPVLSELQAIEYLDIRENNFTGEFPSEYFAENSFVQLRYIGLNQNEHLVIPDVCVRTPFCYKQTILLQQGSGDEIESLTQENMDYIDNSNYYTEESVTDIP